MRLAAIVAIAGLMAAWAQVPPHRETLYRSGDPGLKMPVPIKKPEPEFSDEARAARVQGNVMVELCVDSQGLPQDIVVVSPLGFGLDEKAVEAIEKWRFQPATKNGQPVSVLATIEVSFRFMGASFDKQTEDRRSRYNVVLGWLQRNDVARLERGIKDLADLAKQKYPPAQYLYGVLQLEGRLVPKDEVAGRTSIERSAKQKYGPAMFVVAVEQLRKGIDSDKQRDVIRASAILGSAEAQYFIAVSYETGGEGFAKDAERAMQFYKLCAAARVGTCQFRMGRLLLDRPERRERDLLQALAWLELAGDQGIAGAKELAASEGPLDEGQTNWVKRLKTQMLRKE